MSTSRSLPDVLRQVSAFPYPRNRVDSFTTSCQIDRKETWNISLPTRLLLPETAGEVLNWYVRLFLTSGNLVGFKEFLYK